MKKIIFITIIFLFSFAAYSQLLITDGTGLYIEPVTTLYVIGDINSDNATIWNFGIVDLKGNLENNSGSLFNATSSGIFKFSGTTAQEITGDHDAGFYGITEIDNINGLSLVGADQSIVGELKFTNGKLILNTVNLLLGAIEPSGFSASNYVLTNNSGMLYRTVTADGVTLFNFPVGNSSYNPVFLQNSPSATTDIYGIRVEDQEPAGLSTPNFVDRSWIITEDVPEGSALTVIPHWNSGEELAPFNRDLSAVGHVSGSAYEWKAFGTATGDNPYYREGAEFTDAGIFTVRGNFQPVAICQDVTTSADENCEAFVTAEQVGGGSSDPDGGDVTLSLNPPGPYQLGPTTVTLTVTDDLGSSEQCTAIITVLDNTPPSIICPADIVAVNDPGLCSAVVTFSVTATDNCDNDVTIVCTPASGSIFDVGTTAVTCIATDDAGNTSSCSFNIVVSDVELPVITVISAPIIIWPPNNQLASFDLNDFIISVWDNCTVLGIYDVVIVKATCDELNNGNGNADIVIGAECQTIDLRKERNGNGNGRVYTIFFEVVDEAGNIGTASSQVHVPKNNGGTAIDDGMAYEVVCGNKSSSITNVDNAKLSANPNPFRGSTTVSFTNPETKMTTLKVFNSMGLEVATLFEGIAEAGYNYKFKLDGEVLPQGIYIIHLQSENDVNLIRKIFLNK